MIRWSEIPACSCDKQIDYVGKCFVVDYPLDREKEYRVPEQVLDEVEMLIRLYDVPEGTHRLRVQDDGYLCAGIKREHDEEYPHLGIAFREPWEGRWTYF